MPAARLVGPALAATLLCLPSGVRVAGPVFVESAAATGLAFTHDTGASGQYYMAEQMGLERRCSTTTTTAIWTCSWCRAAPLGGSPKAGGTSRLFRNDLTVAPDGTRTLRFTDVTDRAGVGWRGYGMGVAVADYDNDGDPDLLLTSFGPEALFRNNGDGTFSDVTATAGVSDQLWSTSASFFDYDRDGDLDLFVANYLDFTLANKTCYDSLGARDYCGPRSYRLFPTGCIETTGTAASPT
jgi:hypothetical protein